MQKDIKHKKKMLLHMNGNEVSLEWNKVRKIEMELDDLLRCEEVFWRQQSRISWLKDGDRNTKFFHVKASSRRICNCIRGLFDVGDAEFSEEEVKGALFQISSSKAPRRDGFPVDFYKKILGMVGEDVTKLCLEWLNEGRSMEELNHTLLCLILKVKKVEKVSDLRPIVLCNVIYKCISKALDNMLRKVLGSIL
ncbi:hypothetical protein Ddye_008416 [Dipteronia dyeriana]|uniref:Reverse transcriptase n=1 Tax=Dipteronia dyeriana TaxID=168575 RepID=A0AAD9X9M7_9ROSI|nr:hypothetical protein Ddye_008416 [Dipteronia dyeriana]